MNSKGFLIFRLAIAFIGATAFCGVLLTYYPIAAIAYIPMYLLIMIRAKQVFSR
jgi:hypothetical protein